MKHQVVGFYMKHGGGNIDLSRHRGLGWACKGIVGLGKLM